MELKTVNIEKSDETNFILGQTHFIKSVKDFTRRWSPLCRASSSAWHSAKASGRRLVGWSGTELAMIELPKKNAAAEGL